MDQFTVVRGKKDQLILLNCQNLEYRMINADIEPYHLVLLNSNVSHNLASSEYNNRRADCEATLSIIQKKHPEYQYLVDVPEEVLLSFKDQLSPTMFERADYVIQENKRTLMAADALEDELFEVFGKLLFQSHHGLRHNYQVSCEELDFMVDFAKTQAGVLGARMMGGGFGGCTINIVHKDVAANYIDAISKAYREQFNIELTPIEVSLSDGAEILK
jgi:galactokinase